MARAPRGGLRGHGLALQAAVEKQFKRMLSTDRLTLSHDEYLQLFVEPDLRKDFLRVAQVVVTHVSSFHTHWQAERCVMRLFVQLSRDGATNHPLVPSTVALQLAPGDPLYDRVTSWVTWRYGVGVEFARVRKLLVELGGSCPNPAALRFYWPAIMTLCRELDQLTEFADELSSLRLEGIPPPLPLNVRQACPLAAATVTGAAMVVEKPDGDVAPVEIVFDPPHWGVKADTDINIELGVVSLI